MIAWFSRWIDRLRPNRRMSRQSSEATQAITEARRVRKGLDTQMSERRHEVAAVRLDQMRIRRDIRDDVLSVQGRIAGDYRRELRRSE